MKNKLAMFDMDGTLYDTLEVNAASYGKAMEEYGYEMDRKLYDAKAFGRYYKDFFPVFNIKPQDYEAVHNRKLELYREFLPLLRENSHLFAIAENLKKYYNLALVTSASEKNVSEVLQTFGRNEFFDLVITQEDVSKAKPDPEGFLKAMDYFSAKPKDCIIFEDSDGGVEAAKKTGATVVRVEFF